AAEPGLEAGLAAEFGEAAERALIGFLYRVLGLGVGEDAAGEAEQGLVVKPYDGADRIIVPLLGGGDQLGLGPPFSGGERGISHAGLRAPAPSAPSGRA